MDLGLKNKTALVLGGSSGIGYAIAKEFLKEGAEVIIASRKKENLESALLELKSFGGAVSSVVIDLYDEKGIRKVVADILSKRSIDILINNVGGPAAGNTLEVTLEDWDRGYHSLLRSVVLLSQLTIPAMQKNNWGRVLTITSTTSREMIPKLPVSGAFRAGLSSYAKTLAKDIGGQGVLVNNLLPGPTNTARLQDLKKKSPVFFDSMAKETALGRIAEPEEIAKAAVFLCSSANTYITGTDILVDGGYTKAL